MYLNKVTIIGNLTRDPELKALPSGMSVCSFSVATNESFKGKDGVKKDKVEFHNIIVFGKTAENVAQYMKKGSQILVEGKLQTRSWEGQDGKKLYKTEILANSVQFGSKPQSAKSSVDTNEAVASGSNGSSDPLEDYMNNDINPEDIPF